MKKQMKKFMLVGGIAILSTLFLAGCQSNNAEEETSSEAVTEENVEGSLEGESLRIGTSGVFAPFSYYEEDGQTLTGYDIELLDKLQEFLGYELAGGEYQVQDYAPLVTSLSEGKLDVAAAALCATSERQEIMDFTEPYLNSGQRVMINTEADTGITGIDDLGDKTVGVEKGTASHAYASKNLEGAKIEAYDKITGAFEALQQNKVDAVIQDAPNVAYYVKTQTDSTLEGIGEEFNQDESPYAVALTKDSPYKENFELALKVFEEDGTLKELNKKWTE
ncbi:amino acid ABC transporter substrate-binding protein [Enterococcus sp. 669A]|uniref:Amino acid ABC transporter substrate-binding protein n=1 Tax=Candidatus Enterococcus moelleringii TaxID=2815325 RepID=A0ABS3LC71_9ENTE|nr:ABC transporter substrate-binding protein [Enterococcus sp. 669A]MBO1306675.1 amino acid ABC transporter substrate-binding protein [Enterococcus sp. 669A]